MSFDMFVLTVREDVDDSFERAIVEKAFAPFLTDASGDYWNLHDADGQLRFVNMHVDDAPRIGSFSINRPPAYESFPQFWDALYEVLRQTCTVLVWPGEGPHPTSCVANRAFAEELPADFIEHMGMPAIVSSGAEIDAAIGRSG
jgi:hypothetical protein